MRKPYIMFVMLVGILVMALPVWAAPMAVSDADLASISGKNVSGANDGVGGISTTNQCVAGLCTGEVSGSVQMGSFDWTDDHTTDQSDHKGANDVSGANSAVQQNVVATDNSIVWGAVSGMHFVAGDIANSANQMIDSRAVQDIGGF